MRRRIIAVLLALALLAGHGAASATRIIFDDVPSTHWAFEYIQEAYLANMVHGTGTDPQTGHLLFAPDIPIDAMSFTTLAANTFYAAETAQTPGTTWFDAQNTVLMAHGAFSGMGVVSLRDSIPRHQLVQVGYNILRDLGIHAPDAEATEAAKAKIADWDAIPEGAQESVAAMYALNMITGTGKNFDPMGTTDRAQAVVICIRMKTLLDETLGDWAEPMPSESPEPSDSPEPSGSSEPVPSESPEPSGSPEPGPSESPEPSGSPEPGPSESPEPSGSQAPDSTPAPDGTPDPDSTPEPDPSASPAPSDEPAASEEPAPSETPEAAEQNLPDMPPPKASAPSSGMALPDT